LVVPTAIDMEELFLSFSRVQNRLMRTACAEKNSRRRARCKP
jgi:hypothetical protein